MKHILILFTLLTSFCLISCNNTMDQEIEDVAETNYILVDKGIPQLPDSIETPLIIEFDNWVNIGISPRPNDIYRMYRIDLQEPLSEDLYVTVDCYQIGSWPVDPYTSWVDYRDEIPWWEKYKFNYIDTEFEGFIDEIISRLNSDKPTFSDLDDYFDWITNITNSYKLIDGHTFPSVVISINGSTSTFIEDFKTSKVVKSISKKGLLVDIGPSHFKVPAGSRFIGEFGTTIPPGVGTQPYFLIKIREINYNGPEKIYLRPDGLKVTWSKLGFLDDIRFVH